MFFAVLLGTEFCARLQRYDLGTNFYEGVGYDGCIQLDHDHYTRGVSASIMACIRVLTSKSASVFPITKRGGRKRTRLSCTGHIYFGLHT